MPEIIRPAAAGDIEGISLVERESFSDPWGDSLFYDAVNDRNFHNFVSTEDGKVTGFIISTWILPDVEIQDIAVAKESRGRGIGKRLLQCLFKAAAEDGAERILLEVRKSNTPALSLYKKAGFTEDGIRPHYYEDPVEDAILMSAYLNRKEDQ